MRIDTNDPRLTAYVLNELDANQQAAVEAALKRSPALRTEVENIRQAAATLRDAATSTAAGPAIALSAAERTAMIDTAASMLEAARESTSAHALTLRPRLWSRVIWSSLGVAAGLGVIAIGWRLLDESGGTSDPQVAGIADIDISGSGDIEVDWLSANLSNGTPNPMLDSIDRPLSDLDRAEQRRVMLSSNRWSEQLSVMDLVQQLHVGNNPLHAVDAAPNATEAHVASDRWRPHNSRNLSFEGQSVTFSDGHTGFQPSDAAAVPTAAAASDPTRTDTSEPTSPTAQSEIAYAVRTRQTLPEQARTAKVAQLFASAAQLRKEGRHAESAEALRQIVYIDPTNGRAHELLEIADDYAKYVIRADPTRALQFTSRRSAVNSDDAIIPWDYEVLYPALPAYAGGKQIATAENRWYLSTDGLAASSLESGRSLHAAMLPGERFDWSGIPNVSFSYQMPFGGRGRSRNDLDPRVVSRIIRTRNISAADAEKAVAELMRRRALAEQARGPERFEVQRPPGNDPGQIIIQPNGTVLVTSAGQDIQAIVDLLEEDLSEPFASDPILDNPFLPVFSNPLSTFSIDVDTAAYSLIRSHLAQGVLPPAGGVRIEELLNYFDYDYPPPVGDEPFSATVEIAECPWTPEHRLARIGLKGRVIADEDRPALNLVFLLDVSGSMDSSNRLPLVKESLKLLVPQLRPIDRVAIVTYAGDAGLALPSTAGNRQHEILAAIDALHAGGSTNGGAGIEMAYDIASQNFVEGGSNRVILATDGDFNVGVVSDGDLVKLIESRANAGIFLTVLGVGMGGAKDAKLEKLADHGDGFYAYLDSLDEAGKLFVEKLGGSLVTIAKDVKIQVEFNPAAVAAYRLIGYENRLLAAADFNDDAKDAGEIGAGHTVTALYEIVPAVAGYDPAVAEAPLEPGVDPLRYQTPGQLATAAGLTGEALETLTVKIRYKSVPGSGGLEARNTGDGLEAHTTDNTDGLEAHTTNSHTTNSHTTNSHTTNAHTTYAADGSEVQRSTTGSLLLEFPVGDDGAAFYEASEDFRFAAAVAAFGMSLRGSEHCGAWTLDESLMTVDTARGADLAGYRAEFATLIQKAIQARQSTARPANN